MYTEGQKQQFSQTLVGVADSLDIPPSKYVLAVERYKAVGKWIEQGSYPELKLLPDVYPQGSFRLGTVVRPMSEKDEYDIDLVSQLNLRSTEPRSVKHMIGGRLKEHETYKKMLKDEGRRCWCLGYAEDSDGVTFHMDILPAVPDDGTWMRTLVSRHGVADAYVQHAISATDKDKETGKYKWCKSNPRGYAKWFDDVKLPVFSRVEKQERQRLFENNRRIFARVEDVPAEIVKTPLQRAVQLLKRHRDIHFDGDKKKPISMIITTLCALSYEGEVDLYSAATNIIRRIADYPTTGIIQRRDTGWWIPNPVDPEENFAEKWNEDDRLAKAFFEWLAKIQEDLRSIVEQRHLDKIAESLRPLFGLQPTGTALKSFAVASASHVTPHPRVAVKSPDKPWSTNGISRRT